MPYYVIEVRDSDGNDCAVYNAIILAPDKEAASIRLWDELASWYPDDEDDGGYGTFHACDCECEHAGHACEECRADGAAETDECAHAEAGQVCDECRDSWECSHGGLLTDEDGDGSQREYSTLEAAMADHARYHSLIDLSDPA